MDLKGITWVGHVYQKFEAMCLEVEEIMYQDTVKYVENQVQTVGSSVKKFYSDVVEDFLPPSSMDLVKGKVPSNLPAEQKTDVGICKKPKIGINEEAVKVENEQLNEASLANTDLDKDAGYGQSFHGFHIEDSLFQAASGDTIFNACSDVYSKEYDARSGHNQSGLCMQKICKEENFLPSETSGEIFHMERDLSRGSSSCELLDKNQEASDDQVAVNLTSVINQVANLKSIEEINDELENQSKGASGVLTSSPSTKNCDEIENSSASSSCSSSRGSSCELLDKSQEASDDQVAVNPTSIITQVASFMSIEEINDELENGSKGASGVLTSSQSAKNCDEIENSSSSSSCSSLSAELNDFFMSDGVVSFVGSSLDEDVEPSEFPDKTTFVCHPGLSDYSTVDTLESSILVDQGFEAIQQIDNIQLEETCVLVNGDELCFVPCNECKPRPYKKKIQDAISSRIRSARKHEYKQLAVLCDKDVRYRPENAETKGSPSHGSCELEWELL